MRFWLFSLALSLTSRRSSRHRCSRTCQARCSALTGSEWWNIIGGCKRLKCQAEEHVLLLRWRVALTLSAVLFGMYATCFGPAAKTIEGHVAGMVAAMGILDQWRLTAAESNEGIACSAFSLAIFSWHSTGVGIQLLSPHIEPKTATMIFAVPMVWALGPTTLLSEYVARCVHIGPTARAHIRSWSICALLTLTALSATTRPATAAMLIVVWGGTVWCMRDVHPDWQPAWALVCAGLLMFINRVKTTPLSKKWQ